MLKLNSLSGFGSGVSGAAGSVYGYYISGQISNAADNTDKTDRLTFATSTTAAHTDADSSYACEGPRGNYCGTVYGQHGSGYDGSGYTNVLNTLTWATSVSATTTNTLATSVIGLAQSSDSVTYGYWCGGYSAGVTYCTIAGRATFATGVHALHTDADISTARCYQGQMTHPLLYGYSTGGSTHGAKVATSDRITFSTGVGAAHTDSNLASARGQTGNTSDNTTYGYHSGGNNGVVTDRLTFATSTTAAHTDSDLNLNSNSTQGTSGVLHGFIVGWNSDYSSHVCSVQRITFSTGIFALHTDADGQGGFGRNHPATLSDASPN